MHTTLALPTGRLIVGDPGRLYGDARPLDAALPAGEVPVTVAAGRVELLLGAGEPARWSEAGSFSTPSGYACFLDEAALAEYTDLGDEPVDEFELLAERIAASAAGAPQAAAPANPYAAPVCAPVEAVEFHGLLVVPAAPSAHRLLIGYDAADRVCRVAADVSVPVANS